MYALVSYIPGALGEFLNELRASLVPTCHLLSHLTLLPPRILSAPVEKLEDSLEEKLPKIAPFEVVLGPIEVFEKSNVVYVSLRSGQVEALDAHQRLSRDVLAYREPWEYHPHITLAQEFPLERFEAVLAEARAKWDAWEGPRSFRVEDLVFVKNRNVNCWEALAEYRLEEPVESSPLRTIESAVPPPL